MSNPCGLGSKKKDGAPATFNITPGILCSLFGATHPICRLLDRAIPSLPLPIDKVKALGRGLKDLRYLRAVKDLLSVLPDEDIDTEIFCSVYPDFEVEDMSWFDLFLAFSSLDSSEFFRKVTSYTVKIKWAEFCECRVPGEDGRPPSPVPTGLPPFVPPDLPCWCQAATDQINVQINSANAAIAAMNAENELCKPQQYLPITSPYPPVFAQGSTEALHPTWIRSCGSFVDSDGCFCAWRMIQNGLWVSNCPPNPPFEFTAADYAGVQVFRKCPPDNSPTLPDPDPVDDDWLDTICDEFPELVGCEPCEGTPCNAEVLTFTVKRGCRPEDDFNNQWTLEICGVDDGDDRVLGCTDRDATNYNPLATDDDGSCQFDNSPVFGCRDPNADNYNPDATEEDNSCIYDGQPQFLGCTDPNADNYNPLANRDDESCIYLGCTDPLALNYDPTANQDDGSCIYEEPPP